MLKDCLPKARSSASTPPGCGTTSGVALWLVLVLGAVLLAGCGQKGDLYLPDENPEDAARR